MNICWNHFAMSARLPPSEQLIAFKTVVEQGSFTAAANELCITQSAISHQLAKLERALGRKLLLRSARGLTLTNEGEVLIAAIGEPLTQLIAAFETRARHEPGGILKIQVEPVFAATWLAPKLEDFLQKYPNLQLEQFRAADLSRAGEVDLSIKWGSGNWPNMEAEPLLAVHYVPVCAPALLATGQLEHPEGLCNFTLLHDRRYREWEQWFRQYGLSHPTIRGGHFVDDSYILIEMAIESRGIALTSPLFIKRELSNGDLVCPFPEMRLDLKEVYHIVTHKGRKLSRNAQAFIDWLRAQLTE